MHRCCCCYYCSWKSSRRVHHETPTLRTLFEKQTKKYDVAVDGAGVVVAVEVHQWRDAVLVEDAQHDAVAVVVPHSYYYSDRWHVEDAGVSLYQSPFASLSHLRHRDYSSLSLVVGVVVDLEDAEDLDLEDIVAVAVDADADTDEDNDDDDNRDGREEDHHPVREVDQYSHDETVVDDVMDVEVLLLDNVVVEGLLRHLDHHCG
mmetsp:Transcript_28854/g.33142  ORF Transcript_28854/g.33142 Transcript_28854/m.33142 type:complete len:204 (+) Transcript_28854:227-838(+)